MLMGLNSIKIKQKIIFFIICFYKIFNMNINTTNYLNEHLLTHEIRVDCRVLKIFGVYCSLLFIVSNASNITVLYILLRNRTLLRHIYILIFALAVLSLIGTLVELPLIIITAFSCRYKK